MQQQRKTKASPPTYTSTQRKQHAKQKQRKRISLLMRGRSLALLLGVEALSDFLWACSLHPTANLGYKTGLVDFVAA